MDRSTDMAGWEQFAHPAFRFRFSYPAVTPQGREVERTEERRDGAVRVHLTTRDKEEVYVEVCLFPNLAPPDEYARHRAHLEQRFGLGSTTPLTETSLGGLPAWTYAFHWEQGERSVLLLQAGPDTQRIIYDPRSPLNQQIIATLTLVE
jgi:hypothetical protein